MWNRLIFCMCLMCLLLIAGLLRGQEASLCGDVNGDWSVDVGDAVYIINYVFKGGPGPLDLCCDECHPGETQPCYSGPIGTAGFGICVMGTQSCIDGAWGPCEGEVTPDEEVCDGVDNDCDDVVDDNLTPPPCELNVGVCAGAYKECGGADGWLPCEAADYGPDYELEESSCDGLDNDCDGVYDEMCEGMAHVNTTGCDADTCTIELCASGWADCNGSFSDGCEVDLATAPNSCLTADYYGSFPGDEGPSCGGTDFQISGHGEYFYRFHMYEDCDQIMEFYDVGIRATLTVPTGMDYDLYLYRESCGSPVDQSTNSGSATEYVEYFEDDQMGSDESHNYIVWIRFYSGSSCENWTLRIQSYGD